jgi:hypothetical protein
MPKGEKAFIYYTFPFLFLIISTSIYTIVFLFFNLICKWSEIRISLNYVYDLFDLSIYSLDVIWMFFQVLLSRS